jgi:homoserine kinase type II
MSAAPTDLDALGVLGRYPAFGRAGRLIPLGNRGGFSGACLWRVEAAGAPLCLRAWPARQSDPVRLAFIHCLMTRARRAGLSFVPAVFPADDGTTAVAGAGRLWDLAEWLPGRADFHESPSAARLRAACAAVARVHTDWADAVPAAPTACPALVRRLALVAECRELTDSGWSPLGRADANDPVRPVAERAWRLTAHRVEEVPRRLARWAGATWPVQPCLCDVWHDHLLFEGDRLTGLVDYGAVKLDHPAVDLARLLGSLADDDAGKWQTGLAAYREVRPLSGDEEALARALDETGVVLGAAAWLRWLYEERREYDDRQAVARRLEALVRRMEARGK